MGHRDTGKSFGPGHDGWYWILWTGKDADDQPLPFRASRKAKSAFAAAAAVGRTLTNSQCMPITDRKLIEELENK